MSIERANSIYDIDAIIKEHETLQKVLKEDTASLISLYQITKDNKGGTVANFAKDNEKLNDAIDKQVKLTIKLKAEASAVAGLMNQRFAADAKVITSQTDYAKATARSREETRKLNQETTAQVKAEQAVIGSRDRANAQIKLLTIQKDKLNLLNEKEAAEYDNIVKKIERYQAFLKKTGTEAEKQKMNIGNYQGSAKIVVDAMGEAEKRLQQALAKFGEGSKEVKIVRDQFEALSRVTSDPKFLNIAARVGDTNAELRFFAKQLNQLEDAGLKNTAVYKDVQARLAHLTDQLADTRQEIKALSSDTRNFDLFAGSVSFAADVMQTAAGAAAVFGASEEETEKAIKNVVAIQSIANGVKGIANELTTKGTAANKLYEWSTRQIGTAFDTTATAGARLRAVLMTLGIGLVIAGIGYLIANFQKISDALTGMTDAQRKYNDTLKQMDEGMTKAATDVNSVRSAFALAEKGVITKKEALKKYNETLGDALGKTNDLATAEKNLNDKADDYIKIMGLKARANALFALSAQASTDALLAGTKDQTNLWDKAKSAFLSYVGNYGGSIAVATDAQIKGTKEAAKTATEQADILQKEGERLLTEAGELAKKSKINANLTDTKDDGKDKKAEERLKKQIDDEKRKAKAIADIQKESAEEQIRINKLIEDNEGNEVGARLLAAKQVMTFRKAQALIEYNEAIADEKKVENGKIKVVQKSAEERALALLQYKNKVKTIEEDTGRETADIIAQNNEKIRAQIEKDQELELQLLLEGKEKKQAKLETDYNNDIIALNDRFEKGKISQETYNKKRAKLDEAYHIASLQAEITYTKKVLDIMKLRGVDVEKELRDLAKLEMELSDMVKAHNDKNEKSKTEGTIENLEKIQQAYQVFHDTVSGFLNASFQKQKNNIQAEVDLIDKRKEEDLKANDARVQSDQDRAANAEIINLRAQRQKEALQKRERELEYNKAKAEKALAIAQIVIATALNVAKALTPWGKILAGISGAAQLAIAIATPIPRYRFGRGTGKDELAITGDGGVSEYIHRADGTIEKTPNVDTLVHLAAGDRVYRDKETMIREIAASGASNHSGWVVQQDGSITRADMQEFAGNIVDAVNSIRINTTSITKAGWRHTNSKIHDTDAWVNRVIKGIK